MTDESSQPKVKSSYIESLNPVGRPYKIKSSQELWDKFVAYCDDVENDPWQQRLVAIPLQAAAANPQIP